MQHLLEEKIIKTEDIISSSFLEQKGNVYTFLNPVSYIDALHQKDIFTRFDGIFADGSLLVAAIRLLYGKKVKRRSFDMTSIAPQLFEYAIENNKSIYIVASKQEQVERAVEIFKELYPNLNIIGYRNGFFNNEEEQDEEVQKIVSLQPDFLIVGMGVIMQEKFLLKVKDAGYKGIGFTCGGFIHQTAANQIDYYPQWVDKMNLRFLYRFIKEKHTRKRYLKAAFVFPIVFLKEWMCEKRMKNS